MESVAPAVANYRQRRWQQHSTAADTIMRFQTKTEGGIGTLSKFREQACDCQAAKWKC